MLDHHDRIAGLDQLVQNFEQFAHILEMQAGGRLVENVERLAGGAFGELLGKLDALGFAAGQLGRRLADLDIAQADAFQRFHLVAHGGHGLEEVGAFLDRHVEHVGDRLALELDLQRLAIEAFAVTDITGHEDIRQEVHLDLHHAIALAGLTASTLHIEGETARLVAARLGFGQLGEPFADRGEGAGIGGRVGARRAADR